MRVKSKVLYFERRTEEKHEFVRLGIYPVNATAAFAAISAAGFLPCEREYWMRARKVFQFQTQAQSENEKENIDAIHADAARI